MSEYELEAVLETNSLTLNLLDLQNGKLWSNTFSTENIGKTKCIDPKTSLEDLYINLSFWEDKGQGDGDSDTHGGEEEREGKVKGEEGKGERVWRFEDVVGNGAGVKLFQVGKDGVVTVFNTFVNVLTQKSEEVISVLKLKEQSVIPEKELLKIKFEKERKQIEDRYERKISFLKKTSALNEEKNQQKIKELTEDLEKKTNENQALKQFEEKYDKLYKLVSQSYFHKFQYQTESQKLKYIGGENEWTQFIFIHPISPGSKIKFSVNLIRTQQRLFIVGVTDYEQTHQMRSSHKSEHSVSYYVGENGQKWPLNIQEGGGYRQGETVEVVVDRSKSIITWNDRGVQRASHTCKILGEKERIFMPYVEFYHRDDEVQFQWIG